MRKGFNGLSGLVRHYLKQGTLLSGDVFIFLNKRRDRIKLLVWDRDGWVVWYKVLERGTFELPRAEGDSLELSFTDLQLLLAGIEITSVKRRPRSSSAGKKVRFRGLIQGGFSYFVLRGSHGIPGGIRRVGG